MAKNERFPYPGAIDADGHILEPPDTWEKYIDPQYRDRAIRITKGRDGLEILEIGGGAAQHPPPRQGAQPGAVGKEGGGPTPPPPQTNTNQAPPRPTAPQQ